MQDNAQRRRRVAYISGPIDAESSFRRWQARGSDANYLGTVYLEQFFSVCSQLESDLYVVTTLQGGESIKTVDWCTIHNLPTPVSSSGLHYHFQSLIWFLRVIPALIRFRPDVVVSTAMQNYWFLLCVLRLFNVKLVSSLHTMIWPQFGRVKPSLNALNWLNTTYYRMFASSFMAVSVDIQDQLRELYKIPAERIRVFIPTYERTAFERMQPKDFSKRPFTILFCGRIETNKGIFDLVEIAKRLRALNRGRFVFHMCGEGSQLDALQSRVHAEKLQDDVRIHGQCNVAQIQGFIEESHIFVVPTTTDFEEGFNKVCAEGALSLRPVVTSPVCPALKSIVTAAVPVRPNNVEDYCQAILELSENEALYQAKADACLLEREKFFDLSKSYGAQLEATLRPLIARPGVVTAASRKQP